MLNFPLRAHRRLTILLLFIIPILASAILEWRTTTTPTTVVAHSIPPADTGTLDTKIDVGGYLLHIICAGAGSPTVVLDVGLGGTTRSWINVLPEVAQLTRVCAYDRAGLGKSDPGPKPRDTRLMVQELHALWIRAKVKPPYVLMGQSIAGLNVRVFADEYPGEVVGMVLVDAAHPDQFTRLLNALPTETPRENSRLKEVRRVLIEALNDPNQNVEGIDLAASADEVRATRSLGAMSLVVLTAGLSNLPYNFPDALPPNYEREGLEMQKELAGLSSKGTQIIARPSHHCVQCEQPDLVIDAIRQVVAEARNR